jgi:hypothetical protein
MPAWRGSLLRQRAAPRGGWVVDGWQIAVIALAVLILAGIGGWDRYRGYRLIGRAYREGKRRRQDSEAAADRLHELAHRDD